MAKRIEFIAPVESIRGNMSGRQNLVYAENDNKAFEAPQGQVNYARNYTPRFVGAKRAKDGRKYFSVRTKNGVNLSAKSMKAMALLGGTGAIYAAIVNSDTLRNGVETVYRYLIDRTQQGLSGGIPVDTTFRQYVSGVVRRALESKAQVITFAGGAGVQSVNINNPWVDGGSGTAISIAQKVLVQFWTQLTAGGSYYYVNARKGIAFPDSSFDSVIGSSMNVLGLAQSAEIGGNTYVQLSEGGPYLITADGAYVQFTDDVVANARYSTTDIAPGA
jgi:hypothetical protein